MNPKSPLNMGGFFPILTQKNSPIDIKQVFESKDELLVINLVGLPLYEGMRIST